MSLIKEIREKYPISQNPNSENIGKSRVLEDENSKEIRISFPEKTIWLYTGFRWEELIMYDSYNSFIPLEANLRKDIYELYTKRHQIIELCNIVVDGEYIDEQKDLSLKFKGSKNQRVINVKQSLAQNKIVLYCD